MAHSKPPDPPREGAQGSQALRSGGFAGLPGAAGSSQAANAGMAGAGSAGGGGTGAGEDGAALRVVTFHVGDNLYGLDINSIREIRRLPAITALPGQPAFVEGVITLRGEVIPVLDLARRMNIAGRTQVAEALAKRKLIIGFVENGVMGFIVDSVSMPDTVRKSEIAPPGELFKDAAAGAGSSGGGTSGLVVGLIQRPSAAVQNDRLLILLDLKHVWGQGDAGPLAEAEE
ncbi:MAG: chemotaxis protein CheW [Planctomycetota bacterium]